MVFAEGIFRYFKNRHLRILFLRLCDCASKEISFTIKQTRCTNFTNLFWHETLHVSDSSFVNHQDFHSL
jgi:hypothetical protein